MNTSRELRAERLTTYTVVVGSVGRDGSARYSIYERVVVRLRGTEVVPRLSFQSPSD
jgi:hypothetical protein